MICSTCHDTGKTSRVYIGVSRITCMASRSYYDEQGEFVPVKANTRTTTYRCTNGHTWDASEKCA